MEIKLCIKKIKKLKKRERERGRRRRKKKRNIKRRDDKWNNIFFLLCEDCIFSELTLPRYQSMEKKKTITTQSSSVIILHFLWTFGFELNNLLMFKKLEKDKLLIIFDKLSMQPFLIWGNESQALKTWDIMETSWWNKRDLKQRNNVLQNASKLQERSYILSMKEEIQVQGYSLCSKYWIAFLSI